MSTLYCNAIVITMDPERRIWDNGAVCVEGSRIIAVGDSRELLKTQGDAQLVDCGGNLIFPGLIEPGVEVGSGLLGKQFADDPDRYLALRSEFEQLASEEALAIDAALLGSKAAMWGITTLGVLYRKPLAESHSRMHCHEVALRAAGVRLLSFAQWGSGLMPSQGGVFLDAEMDQIDPQVLAGILRRSNTTLRITATPQRLTRLQEVLFDTPAKARGVLAGCHGVRFSQIRAMAQRGFGVIYEPNTFLPTPHVVEMLSEQIPVALSSRGEHSRNSLDLLQTARRAQLFNITAYDDYHYLPYGKTLEMLTIEAARVLGIDSFTGSLEPGKDADFNIFDWHQPHVTPNFMPLQGAMARGSGRDFVQVVAKGKILKAQGRLRAAIPTLPKEIEARWWLDV